jgi:hypothetical protein
VCSNEGLCPVMDAAVQAIVADAYARGWLVPDGTADLGDISISDLGGPPQTRP